jgi:UDP-N-acetyl-alpha-D-muramoyl-L-alanyl-L-glutamate epimerase
VQDVTTADASRGTQLRQLREAYPVFRISGARAARGPSSVRLEFAFAAGPLEFRPVVAITGLGYEETAPVTAPTARRMIRALAIIEAFSYWKALCSPVIEVAIPAPDAAELDWWQAFWPGAMGEFFYRNGIDYTDPGFLAIKAAADSEPAGLAGPGAPGEGAAGPPLVMFSGGKDSLALARVIRAGGAPADFFLYNAASRQRALAESLAGGGRVVEVRREILPGLLRLNAAGHPNGHTPFSAYLAVAAMLAGYLRGSEFAVAGNSRSDDEPNVESYLGRPVNHQWTKSYEFEAALSSYRDRWLPGAPAYSSPLRPLYELQIIASLSDDIDGYLRTASCNRVRGGWCRSCAKCAWVFLATAALFGHDLAIAKTGGDVFADPGLAPLYAEMAGLTGSKPFECTGSEDEVRTAIRAVTRGHVPGDFPALAACLADPAITTARPLSALLADWGRDDLVPAAILRQVREAVSAAGRA